ncbi:MAG: PrsW family intramembrane metalloprotease [Bacilli bacterium]|nr:PrsW family intramembrane metalloprotease [Bacilli bacterium]
MLLLLLVIGALGSYVCYRFEMHYGSYFKKIKDCNYLEVLFYAVFGVAIFEEGYKWVVSTIPSIIDKCVDSLSIVTYSVFTSIGFALFENIVYFAIPYGISTSIGRLFTAFPSHICNAIWMGYFLSLFKEKKGPIRYLYLILSIIAPIIVHALYNSFLYGKDATLMNYHIYYYVSLCIVSIILLVITIKKRFRNS